MNIENPRDVDNSVAVPDHAKTSTKPRLNSSLVHAADEEVTISAAEIHQENRQESAQSEVGGSTRRYARQKVSADSKREAWRGQRETCCEQRSGECASARWDCAGGLNK